MHEQIILQDEVVQELNLVTKIYLKHSFTNFLKKKNLDVDFWYDNTSERGSRRSFNSNRFVGHGPRTDDEMSLGFIGYAEIDEPKAMSTTNDNN